MATLAIVFCLSVVAALLLYSRALAMDGNWHIHFRGLAGHPVSRRLRPDGTWEYRERNEAEKREDEMDRHENNSW